MDTPEVQIRPIIHALTQGSREDRQEALEKYFLPNAYFVHPFCRVPSFDNYDVPFTNSTVSSRWFISLIYEWYRILSPDIKISIDSTAFDKDKNVLYATIHQTFTLWFVPFSLWQANVKLVTVLELEQLSTETYRDALVNGANAEQASNSQSHDNHEIASERPKRYFIKGQQDNYQVEDFLKFIAPWGASILWIVWQLCATLICAVGVALFRKPTALFRERILGSDRQTLKKKQ